MPQTLGRTRPSIYLVAASGHPNYGDELIAATWLKRLARLLPGSEVWVDCSNPGGSAVLLGDLHPRVRFTDTFWRLCWEAPSQEPWEVATFVQRAVKDPGVAPRWLAGIELAAQMDVVHVVGGGFINGLWPRHVGLLAASVAAAGRSGGRAVMTGQSLWPVAHGAETLVRELAAQFDLVDVRDQRSAQLLSTVGAVSLTGDDMFLGIDPQLGWLRTGASLPRFVSSTPPAPTSNRGCLLRVVSEHEGKGSLDHRAASRARCVWRVRFVSSSRSSYLQREQFVAQHDCHVVELVIDNDRASSRPDTDGALDQRDERDRRGGADHHLLRAEHD